MSEIQEGSIKCHEGEFSMLSYLKIFSTKIFYILLKLAVQHGLFIRIPIENQYEYKKSFKKS